MRIASTDAIAGWPAGVVRSLLREMKSASICTAEGIATLLPGDSPTAAETVAGLLQAGLIEHGSRAAGRVIVGANEGWSAESYTTTIAGNALAIARFNRPVTRRTAERALAQLLDRVADVNRPGAPFGYRVERVVVFGSYLTQVDRVGDVDVAVALTPRHRADGKAKSEAQLAAENARIRAALTAGRRFANFLAQLSWPEQEVRMFLRAGSRVLSFHDIGDPILQQCETRPVFPRPAS